MTTGNKQKAARLIQEAYDSKSISLDLADYCLDSFPSSIRDLTSLRILDLRGNNISSLPSSIGNLTSLVRLILDCNNLSSLPSSIGNLSSLRFFNASNNHLSPFPTIVTRLSHLIHLDLYNNNISSTPTAIGNLHDLKYLDLAYNNLSFLPSSIGYLSKLETLKVHYNSELRELPLSLGNIRSIKPFYFTHTKIPCETVDSIFEQSFSLRGPEAEKVSTWQTFAKQTNNRGYSSAFLTQINKAQKSLIHRWLIRLERTRDFNKDQSKLAQVACSMLETLNTCKAFSDLFFAQVNANLESCEDRAAMSLNEIYTSWKIHTLPDTASTKEKLDLLFGVAKTEELRVTISQILQGKNDSESVEIYLYYEHLLKDRLKLVSAIDSMSNAIIGKRDWIVKEDLINTIEENYLKRAVTYPAFEKLVEEDTEYKAAKEAIIDASQKQHEIIQEENHDSSEDYKSLSDALLKETERKIKKLSIDWVKNKLI